MNHLAQRDDNPVCADKCRIAVCIPVFNDWESVRLVLPTLARALADLIDVSVIIVDDGSTDMLDAASLRTTGLSLSILQLRRNVGHQRAIAIGLAAIAEKINCDAVVVMDGDGEDNPAHVPALLAEARRHTPASVVFAKRMRRTENLGFRVGYFCFRVLHRMLTGHPCDVGNFSVVPRVWLNRLACSSELWIHYSAAVACSRLPVSKVPCDRAHRIAGRSHMKLTSLVVHGLSAISVFSETVGVRICLALGAMAGLTIALLMAALYLRFMTDLAVPGWATYATGLLLILLLNLLLLTTNSVLGILGARNNVGFIPSRDWSLFVSEWMTVDG